MLACDFIDSPTEGFIGSSGPFIDSNEFVYEPTGSFISDFICNFIDDFTCDFIASDDFIRNFIRQTPDNSVPISDFAAFRIELHPQLHR